jgi:argininosuccinate lyase
VRDECRELDRRRQLARALAVLQGFHASIEKDVYDVLSLRGSLNARNTLGGTAPAQVTAQIERHRARLG